MITVKKLDENKYYVALISDSNVLNRNNCYIIKKELIKLMKAQREITLDLVGVENIDFSGLEILLELRDMMDAKKCKFTFTNVDPSVSKKISAVKSKKQQEAEENMFEI